MIDDELREQFRRLKQQDEARVRVFSSYTQGGRRWTLNYRLAGVALALFLLIGITLTIRRKGEHPRWTAVQLSQWRAPTDSLLRTPGGELLRTLPRFGDPLTGDRTSWKWR